MFENAKWITRTPCRVWRMPSYEELSPAPYLTKSFDVEKAVDLAVLNIVAYGQGAYFINGKKIPDSYLPTVHSLTDKTLVYSSYDLTGDIVNGKNKIGVVIGNDFQTNASNPFRGYVRMIAQLDITYKDGTEEQIVSDTSWKTADSPILFDMRRCGEKFDARLKINGWCDPDFDDTAWDNAFICKGLGGKLTSDIDTAISISLFAGMYEKSEEQAEADRLAKNITDNDKRLFCGIHGARTIFDMLTKFGYTQLAFDVVTNDKYPGYAASVKAGLDTLPESFRFATKYRPDGFLSLNHHFFSHIDAWFLKTLAGIKINGFPKP